jgi:antirestriction protein ArdC
MPLPPVFHGSDKAYYSPMEDKIVLPEKECFFTSPEYYSTFFHEAVHSTLHPDRLNRKNDSYAEEELVAEIGASSICHKMNIGEITIDNSQAYINIWIKRFKDKPNMIVKAAAQSAKAVNYLLQKYEAQVMSA